MVLNLLLINADDSRHFFGIFGYGGPLSSSLFLVVLTVI